MSSKRTVTKRRSVPKRRRRVASRKSAEKIEEKTVSKKQELTADELILRAWKKTYANRHHRLDV